MKAGSDNHGVLSEGRGNVHRLRCSSDRFRGFWSDAGIKEVVVGDLSVKLLAGLVQDMRATWGSS